MSKRNVLTDLVDSIYEGVAVSAETAVILGEVVDKAGRAVQNGIEHLKDVWPEWFTKEEESETDVSEDDDASYETVEPWRVEDWDKVYTNEPVLGEEKPVQKYSRGYMVSRIAEYLEECGFHNTIWHTNPVGISDEVVARTFEVMFGPGGIAKTPVRR